MLENFDSLAKRPLVKDFVHKKAADMVYKLFKDQIKVLNESQSAIQRKIDDLYANNIIIAKEGDAQPLAPGKNTEATFMANVQGEIRKLHSQLQKKEHVINQLKFLIGKQQAKQQAAQGDQAEQAVLSGLGASPSHNSSLPSLNASLRSTDGGLPDDLKDELELNQQKSLLNSYKATKEKLNLVRGSMFAGGPRQSIKLEKDLAEELHEILASDDF